MKLFSNVQIHYFRVRSTVSWRALAGIIVLIAVPGILSLDEGVGDVDDNVDRTISSNENVGRLSFQQDGGINVVVSNNGISAYKKTEIPAYAVALTSRHLKSNELFEMNVERKSNIANETVLHLAVGVTNLTYADLARRGTVIQPRDWMMRWHIPNNDQDSSPDVQNFIKNGVRLGVMRKENGSLNIFVNGVDEGEILSNVPEPVYGAVEFMSMGLQASIVDTSSTEAKK